MNFDNILGNEKVKEILNRNVQNNNILHSYMFVGPEGIGKSIFASIFAKAILCTSNDNKPCEECKSCISFNGNNNPDFIQINSEDGKSIKIEQIRYMQEKVLEKPVQSNKKVYIINDSDLMTKEAQNCLLKTLEEPPEYVVIILICLNENRLLTTIKSRCMKISFNKLSNKDILKYLQQNKIEQDMSENMFKLCDGSISKAIKLQESTQKYLDVERIIEGITKSDITQIWNKSEVLYKSKDDIFDLLDYINIIMYEKLKKDNKLIYVNCIEYINQTKKRLNSNSNYEMSIDNLLLRIWEELN